MLMTLHFMWYIDCQVQLSTDLWDLQTRTAGDYTVETEITKQHNVNFYNTLTQQEMNNGAPLMLMKIKLI